MQRDPRDILIEVLTIISFQDDKEAYADRFIQNCEKQALLNVLSTLSEEKKQDFKQKMVGVTDQERAKQIITEYVIPEQYNNTLKKTAETTFRAFIEVILPTLSKEQVDKLQSLLNASVLQ